jgi:hypothetical protein
MINFVEDLPSEWRPKWEEMKRTTKDTLDEVLGKFLSKTTWHIRESDDHFQRGT